MRQRVTILVVDNDVATRRLLCAVLSSNLNYQVVTVAHFFEALKVIDTGIRFDLVISEMPHCTTFTTIEEIRKNNGHVPYLVLSSMQTDESVARALQFGADDYLQKPVDIKELRRTVTALLDYSTSALDQEPHLKTAEHERFAGIHRSSSVRSLEEGTFVELTAPTDPRQAERFQRLAERLLAVSLNEKEQHNMHLALEEILRNAIEWGNQHDQSKKMKLSYCLMPDRVTFRVEDEGAGFDHSGLQDPSIDPVRHISERRASGKRMGGWGVFLTRKMMDEVTYNPKGNVVFLTKFLNRNGSANAASTTDLAADITALTQPSALPPSPSPPSLAMVPLTLDPVQPARTAQPTNRNSGAMMPETESPKSVRWQGRISKKLPNVNS